MEFFSLNFRNVIIFVNIFTTSFFAKINVYNFSIIDAIEVEFSSIADAVISFKINMTEI